MRPEPLEPLVQVPVDGAAPGQEQGVGRALEGKMTEWYGW